MYCECGCGNITNIAKSDNTKSGIKTGEHYRFIKNHHRRKSHIEYIVDEKTNCWIWQLAIKSRGYGNYWHEGKCFLAHRFYYEKYKGKIPEGLVLDHLCRNRSCVNPELLEPVTQMVNNQRGKGGFSNFKIHNDKMNSDDEYRRSHIEKLIKNLRK